jgi:hypothetical protein
MADYVFYPVTGDGKTQATGFTWNTGTINFNTGTDWAAVTFFNTLTIAGSVTTGIVPTTGDNIGLIAGEISDAIFAQYKLQEDPAKGKPFINSNTYSVDVLLNSGSIELGSMVLAGFNVFPAVPQFPTLDVEGAALTLTGSILDTGTAVFPPIDVGFGQTISSAQASGGGTIDLGQTATVAIGASVAASIVVNFNDAANNVLEIDGDSKADPTAFAGTITNFAVGDTIVLPNVPSEVAGVLTTANYDPVSGDLSIVVGDPTTIDLHMPGFSLTPGPVALTPDGNGIEIVVCFLAGTSIATPIGETPVEALSVGDLVRTASGRDRAIKWIGTGQVLATPGRRTGNTPVIVRKGALADAVPSRDLRLTKGHSLFLDGVLIPVEHLVNHRSIIWDERAREVTIYHVELETHDVLIADGAPAESYRDDGNRWQFRNANSGWCLPPQPPCAPVLTGGPIVDAVWRRLVDRIPLRNGPPLTREPDLHLLVDGKRIDAIRRSDSEYAFRFTATPRNVRIRSRAAVPQEIGTARDERALGVALRRIMLAQPLRQRAIDANDTLLSDGFHTFEADHAFRWTNGDAAIPAGLFAGAHGPCMLMLQLGATAQYIDEGTQVTERVA